MQNNAVWQAAISSCTWLLVVILGEKYVSMRTMYGCLHIYAVLIHGVVQFSKTHHSKWILFHVLKYLSVYDKGNVAASE
jgi:hypothetical protein